MHTESLKLVSGVLALRRFSVEELAAFSDVNRATTSSWLSRYQRFFTRAEPVRTGARGRPPTVHQLRPDAARRLRSVIRAVPEADLESAYRGDERPGAVPLQALSRARAYAEMLSDAVRDEDRDEVIAQFAPWVSAARRQATGFERALVAVVPEDLAQLAEYEELLKPPADVPTPSAMTILERAGRLVDACEANVWTQRARPRHVMPGDFTDPLTVLAALALSDKFLVSTEARRSIHEAAEVIDVGSYRRCLTTILERARCDDSYENALMVVIDGMRWHTPLLRDGDLARQLRQSVVASSLGRVRGAYLMACYEMPITELERSSDISIFPFVTISRNLAVVGPSGALGRISTAIEAIAEELSAFIGRLAPMHGGTLTDTEGLQAFRGAFEERFLLASPEGGL